MSEVSRLPSSMQARKEQLQTEVATPNPDTAAATTATATSIAETVTPPANADKVTITREEFNDLQAKADRVKAAEGRQQAMRDDLEALQHRLTELESASKGNREPDDAPAAPGASLAVETPVVELTAKEKEDFEQDTIDLMTKIANNVFSDRIKELIPQLNAKLAQVETVATSATQTVGKISTKNFTDRVREKVAEFSSFDDVVQHKHWPEFLESEEAVSGLTYGSLVKENIAKERVDKMVNIFKIFFDKYMKETAKPAGYEGLAPESTLGSNATDTGAKVEVLKYSERKAAHEKYIRKEISFEEFTKIKEKFDIADREGRVDYEN